ncbi:TetR/AcrR family transcriptional regulator [Nonomuraea sp. B5E05]|uniref:TetR/AcrR family transcriptional regulator n=1 Tax=Nonomuraea sp. B5E05 TaxID=3153569 RepID=UPI0032619784
MTTGIPEHLITAAVDAARRHNLDVADVSLKLIADEAGISRSTLLRRIGGTRAALDRALLNAGVDPGGRPPVRERALEAAAHLIAGRGLAELTLETVADSAQCSLPSLREALGGRDALLTAVFERHTPLLDVEELLPGEDVETTVRSIYRALVRAFQHEPRVLPALVADVFSRPDGPAARVLRRQLHRYLTTIGTALSTHMKAGRIRRLPVPLVYQLMVAPLAVHLLTRPALGDGLPPVEEACEIFAEAFLNAVQKGTSS